MTLLSAFADEISPRLKTQLAVVREQDIQYLDLRSVGKTNVLDLTNRQVQSIKRSLAAAGVGVAAIGSPIGKVSIDVPFEEQLRRFDRAVEIAQTLGADFVRIFSYYPPEGARRPTNWEPHRREVTRRMRDMTRRIRDTDIVLLLENDTDLYGDTVARCVDLLGSVDDPQFRAVFDPANFIQSGEVPFPDAYESLRPWIAYVHVKDAKLNGTITAAGDGIARWPEMLARMWEDGYDGFFSLEPHLASAGQFSGFSGTELFQYAARRFQGLLAAVPRR